MILMSLCSHVHMLRRLSQALLQTHLSSRLVPLHINLYHKIIFKAQWYQEIFIRIPAVPAGGHSMRILSRDVT